MIRTEGPHAFRILCCVCNGRPGLLGAAPALANGKDISFEVDTVSVNDEDGSMLAVGNVQMKQGDDTDRRRGSL